MNDKAFEKWWSNNYSNLDHRDILRTSEKAWQAAKADSEQEIAELKAYKNWQAKLIHQQNAHINVLREAFRKIRSCYGDGYEVDNIARQALSKTPAQSLQAFENEVIEMCAKVCDEAGQPNKDEIHTDAQWAAKLLAANIRALKDQL